MKRNKTVFYSFELMLYVLVNNYSHVGALSPFMGFLPDIGNAMASEILEYNRQSYQLRLIHQENMSVQ